MRMIRTIGLAITVTAVLLSPLRADEPKKGAANKLIGTWKLVSGKYGGEEFKLPDGATQLKHVTPAHFMWATYDRDGKVTRAAGGPYTLMGDTYEETPEYGISSDFEIIKGKAQTFKWKIDGNKWYHNGKLSNGLEIEEAWERVESK